MSLLNSSTEKHSVVYVVGGPATGKTTLVRSFLDKFYLYLIPKPKWTISGHVCAAGHYGNGKFDGADTIPFNGAMDALRFWKENDAFRCNLTFLDGDRMSNQKSLKYVSSFSQVICIHLSLDEEVRLMRSKSRSNQNEAWAKGRVTKSRRFYEGFVGHKIDLNADQDPGDVETDAKKFLYGIRYDL